MGKEDLLLPHLQTQGQKPFFAARRNRLKSWGGRSSVGVGENQVFLDVRSSSGETFCDDDVKSCTKEINKFNCLAKLRLSEGNLLIPSVS
jgi:hypothetical protein